MRLIVFVFALFGVSSANAKILLNRLDEPLQRILSETAEPKYWQWQALTALATHWNEPGHPTLREFLQTPRSVLYQLRSPEAVAKFESLYRVPHWTTQLQPWLARRGLSLEMSDQEIQDWQAHPYSFKYKPLKEAGLPLITVRLWEDFGFYTVFDVLKQLPQTKDLNKFLARIKKDREAGELHRTLQVRMSEHSLKLLKADYKTLKQAQKKDAAALKTLVATFRREISPPLAESLIKSSVNPPDQLFLLSDDELQSLGLPLPQLDELYSLMKKFGIYDAPERCSKIFEN